MMPSKLLPKITLSPHPSNTSSVQWSDWKWQARNMLTTPQDFEPFINLSSNEQKGFSQAHNLFRVGVTPYYANLMDKHNPWCPIRMQAIPSFHETEIRNEEMTDPLGESLNNPAPSVIHKYPDRALLLLTDRCAIYCRHCNRRRLVGGDTPINKEKLDKAFDYLRKTSTIRDVLISGGDPLLLSTHILGEVLSILRSISHIEIIRIGTRIPVVLPMRIDEALAKELSKHHPLFINTHFNHPKEITKEAKQACETLINHGIPMGNQTVLLRQVNSSVTCMRQLMRDLLKIRVRPYYMFQGDTVTGVDYLRTPVEKAIEIMEGMRGWISGMAIPHLVLDAPGGGGKIPIGPTYIQNIDKTQVHLRNYRQQSIVYPQPIATDCTVPYDDIFFENIKSDDY